MDQQNWTQKVRQAIQQAIETAREAGHPQLTALHLAVALLEDPEGLAKQAVLRASNEQTYLSLLRVLKKRLVRLPSVSPLPGVCVSLCAWAPSVHAAGYHIPANALEELMQTHWICPAARKFPPHHRAPAAGPPVPCLCPATSDICYVVAAANESHDLLHALPSATLQRTATLDSCMWCCCRRAASQPRLPARAASGRQDAQGQGRLLLGRGLPFHCCA